MPTERRRALFGLDLLLRAVVAGVLAYAGLTKLLEPAVFAEQVANYQWQPELALLVAAFLPPTELVAALGLWLPWASWRRAAGLLTAGLFALFTVAVIRSYLLGIDVDCGCFGAGSGEIGPLTIARNLALTAAAAGVLWLTRPTHAGAAGTA